MKEQNMTNSCISKPSYQELNHFLISHTEASSHPCIKLFFRFSLPLLYIKRRRRQQTTPQTLNFTLTWFSSWAITLFLIVTQWSINFPTQNSASSSLSQKHPLPSRLSLATFRCFQFIHHSLSRRSFRTLFFLSRFSYSSADCSEYQMSVGHSLTLSLTLSH